MNKIIQGKKRPILVVGVARSGTTWVANTLAQAPGTELLHEPDNEKQNILAHRWKRGYHRMPFMGASVNEPDYLAFWRRILYGAYLPNRTVANKLSLALAGLTGDRIERDTREKCNTVADGKSETSADLSETVLATVLSQTSLSYQKLRTKRRIVKSVHTGLTLSFISRRLHPEILIVLRHPASVVSSCLKLRLPDANREVFRQEELVEAHLRPFLREIERVKDPVAQMALQTAIFHYVWEQEAKENPHWKFITHESLCKNPSVTFQSLYQELELEWTPAADQFLLDHNRPGNGFKISRESDTLIEKWKQTLTPQQIDSVRQGYRTLPVSLYSEF